MNTDELVRRFAGVVRRQHLALAIRGDYCSSFTRHVQFLKSLPSYLPNQHKFERFLIVLVGEDDRARA